MSDRRSRQRSEELPWVEAIATVVSSEIHRTAWGQAEARGRQNADYFVTKFTFRVKGVVYDSEEQSPSARKVGEKVTIRYDPSNPRYNTVTGPEQSMIGGFWLWLLIVLGALIFFFVLRHFDVLR